MIGRCTACNHVQHADCWMRAGRCTSYDCADIAAGGAAGSGPDLIITADDVERAPALPRPGAEPPYQGKKRMSALAVVSFGLAIFGIVAAGVPGLVAVGLGAIAIGSINARRNLRGTTFAVLGIIIGALDVLGWCVALGVFVYHHNARGPESDFPIRPPLREHYEAADLSTVPGPIQRAVRANVLLIVRQRMQTFEGSGVVVERRDGRAVIVTNRHVIDGPGGSSSGERDIEVTFWDGSRAEATVTWRAPDGVDVAVVECSDGGSPLENAVIRLARKLVVGENVFAVGNPYGLAWSYSTGVVSAIRKHSGDALRMIQTQVPLNPGNSGGGLYDAAGALVGINTMITDRTRSEGISFSIGIAELVPQLEAGAGVTIERAGPAPDGEQP